MEQGIEEGFRSNTPHLWLSPLSGAFGTSDGWRKGLVQEQGPHQKQVQSESQEAFNQAVVNLPQAVVEVSESGMPLFQALRSKTIAKPHRAARCTKFCNMLINNNKQKYDFSIFEKLVLSTPPVLNQVT